MPVNTERKDYAAFCDLWCRLRDTFKGRDAVLERGQKYVPDLHGLDGAANKNYRSRGSFYNAVSRTVFGLVGAIFQKAPVFVISPQFEEYLSDVTLTNVTMQMFSLEVAHETMLVGRHGVLVDMAQQQPPPAQLIDARPYFVSYIAEDIINWRVQRIGGDEKLVMVVLKESIEVEDPKDPFELKTETQYRVLQLVGGVYSQQLWRKKPNEEEFITYGGPVVPLRRGKSLNFIPFVFLGTTHVTSDLGQPPLIDLADVNLAHFRNSVDYEYGLHLVALPTPWMAGAKGTGDGKMKIGPSQVWELSENGKAGMLEFTGNGLKAIYEAMDEKKRQMATLGARMLEAQQKLNETATAVLVRHSGDYANLRTIAQTVEQGLSILLQMMAWWQGTEDQPKDVKASAELNKEFTQVQVDPTMVQTALLAVQAGKMSFKTFYGILTTGGWAREGIDADAELNELNTQKPTPPPVAEVKPPASAAA